MIARLCSDATGPNISRAIFVAQRDVEAQTWAKHLIKKSETRVVEYIVDVLDETPDEYVALGNVTAYERIKPEVHSRTVDS